MENKKKVIFTSALLAGAAVSFSGTDLQASTSSNYSDLGTGAELRTNILYDSKADTPLNVFEMKCAAKEKESDKKKKEKNGKAVEESKAKEGKCGDGKCGSKSETDTTKKGNLKAKKVDSATKAKKVKEGKTKEGKCGEGKCGTE